MSDHRDIVRTVPLLDYEIVRGSAGDGRTVVAYAATFGDPYEVRDADGHYDEVLNTAVFNKAIKLGAVRTAQVFFNHGKNLWGMPSDRFSVPIGTPEEIRADSKGLLTTTRYAQTDLGDEILQLWIDGAIRGQSFRGPIFQSRSRGQGPNGRPIIERMQLGLREYGPAPHPLNMGAGLVALRSQQLVDELRDVRDELSPQELDELAKVILGTPAPGNDTPDDDAVGTAQAADTTDAGQSTELLELANANRRRRDPSSKESTP